ncbi:MAG TPA: Uma2 family endonuclease [Isosphaeraceae bacterium]|nr:Uma2 family endonuclease [Isosphaeraceae bacterium]
MGTVRNRHAPPDRKTKTRAKSVAASFDYGWRYVEKKGANGRVDTDMVPLTLEDILHPRLGDHHVLTRSHILDCTYLHDVLAARLAEELTAVVLADTGVYWDIPKLKHHSPDIAVILGVRHQKDWKTFHVAKEGVRPVLIIEVTSPKTRSTDLETKVQQYARAGVLHYVIADAEEGKGKPRRLRLLAYRLEGGIYRAVAPDPRGRVWLEPVGLWLGVTTDKQTGADRLALIDPKTGREIGDYTAISRRLEVAEAEARAAQRREQAAKKREQAARIEAAAERERAEAEAQARAHAEELLRQAEAELRRLRGDGKKPRRSR